MLKKTVEKSIHGDVSFHMDALMEYIQKNRATLSCGPEPPQVTTVGPEPPRATPSHPESPRTDPERPRRRSCLKWQAQAA